MLDKIDDFTIEKVQKFIDSHTHQELIENNKILLRQFLREMERFMEIDSYSMDYSNEDFNVSIVKNSCQEHILNIKR